MKIIFLDVDGVLFSTRAAVLRANAGLGKLPIAERMERVTFDVAAVELINRAASRTGAKIVVHSDWRKTLGLEGTRAKLLQQGLDPGYLDDDWHTPVGRLAEKAEEIESWLDHHRLTPKPVWPGEADEHGIHLLPYDDIERNAMQSQVDAFYDALADYGIHYVVIDDQKLNRFEHRQIVVDQDEGFGVGDYKVSLGMLGGADAGMGAYPVSAADWAMVPAAHDAAAEWGPQMAAASAWLHLTPKRNDPWPRARRLSADEVTRENKFLSAFGHPSADADGGAQRMRRTALEDLPKPASGEIG
jgi:hypothetical protein